MCFFYCTFIYLLLRSPGRPTAANDGQRRPTKTKKGPNDARCVVWALGKGFLWFFLRFIDNASPQQPTTANAGQHRPTKANAGPQRRKRAQTTAGASLGPQVSFFFFFLSFIDNESSQQPTTANAGQQRPTKTKQGPNDARPVVWARGVSFLFFFFSVLLTTKAYSSQRRPIKANTGQCRPTAGPRGGFTHHHHPPLPTSSTSSTTITRARDASRTLVSSFYSPPSPSLGPETRLEPSVSFYLFYFILYFTGAETRLGPLFVLFYFYFILSTSQGLRCVSVCCFFFFVIVPFTSQGPGFKVQT